MSTFLRPHHLLCLYYFRGMGYNDEFTANMHAVLARMDCGDKVLLQAGCDALCAHCPHAIEGVCVSGQKVKRIDQNVLTFFGLHMGQYIDWRDMKLKISVKCGVHRGDMSKLCNGCQWLPICNGIRNEIIGRF